MKLSLYSFTLDSLRQYLTDNDFARYAADQIYSWVYKRFTLSPAEWTNVSKELREHFLKHIDFSIPEIIETYSSEDATKKFLLKLSDGKMIECVSIPAEKRKTFCLSSQVGCSIGCSFCHTATLGLERNLSSAEVVGQFLAVVLYFIDEEKIKIKKEYRPFTNLVYMGQGEPLSNFSNMKEATLIFMEAKGPGFGQRKITLSTAGLAREIERLVDFPPVNVAISLHSPFNDVRTRLMPINKKYDLTAILSALSKVPLKAHRKFTFEYLLIDGLNDRKEDVEELSKLLDVKTSKINLIPFNSYPGSAYKTPSKEKIRSFHDQLLKKGFNCTLRVSKGQDILAACGQLKAAYCSASKVQ